MKETIQIFYYGVYTANVTGRKRTSPKFAGLHLLKEWIKDFNQDRIHPIEFSIKKVTIETLP